jgi:hypothetical protein
MYTTMPVPIHLLERAYQLINANQFQNAELVLDAVVRVDPQNVEAWKTYLMIHQSQNDLDWLKERILRTKELSEANKTELVNYYRYLTLQLNGAEEVSSRTNSFHLILQEEKVETILPKEKIIQFELLDVFDYPTKFIRSEIHSRPRSRSRRRTIYIPFAFDVAGYAFKAISHVSFAKQIADRIQKTTIWAGDFIKNPKEAYNKFSKSPHFEKYTEVALLAFFILGVRLVIENYYFGYILLGMFFVGGRWWLLNFGNHNTTSLSDQSRMYLQEHKYNLSSIETEMGQEQKTEREDLEKMSNKY